MPAGGTDSPCVSESPRLSVVVASVDGWAVLEPTLDALDAQPERAAMEVIVVDAVAGATRERLESRRPAVVLVPVAERLSIPRLRALGVRSSRAPLVAILEDHVAVSPGWTVAPSKSRRWPRLLPERAEVRSVCRQHRPGMSGTTA